MARATTQISLPLPYKETGTEFKTFPCEAKILSENMAKKSATINEVENLIKELFHWRLL